MYSEKEKKLYLPFSRQTILHIIDDFIRLYKHRRDTKNLNDTQLYGGQVGVVLEGPPGVGKSEMLLQYLYGEGFIKGENRLDYVPPEGEDVFYHVPISLEDDTREKLLIKARNEGAIVILDELNTAPPRKELIGYDSGVAAKNVQNHISVRPKNPGGIVIGTQNPNSMDGRKDLSIELPHRFIICSLLSYSQEEALEIIEKKGVPQDLARIMVDAFFEQCNKANRENLNPPPVFRDLINAAEEYLKLSEQLKLPLNSLSKSNGFFKRQKTSPALTTTISPKPGSCCLIL
jgi:hypothetical protein